ncbi:hypothetical protein MRX96_038814 [Rhipicephalus microplus]
MVNFAEMIGGYSRQVANSTSAGTSDAGASMKLSEAEKECQKRKMKSQKKRAGQKRASEGMSGVFCVGGLPAQ